MDDYIYRQAAIDKFHRMADVEWNKNTLTTWANAYEEAADLVEAMQSADVEPVRHGHWQITDAYPHNVYCSECHKRYAQTHWAVWEDGSLPREYCPNCGARMDGGDDVEGFSRL